MLSFSRGADERERASCLSSSEAGVAGVNFIIGGCGGGRGLRRGESASASASACAWIGVVGSGSTILLGFDEG
jgi:hypothetical protein